jgi:hypothetical protein
MNDLATFAINAHGGLDRWRRLKTVSAHLLQGGVLWKVKGQEGVLDDVHLTVDLRKEWASHRPFGQPNLHSSFHPDRVAIETSDGQVVEERANPRESFRDHKFESPWDRLQLAYFAGYAMWTYMNGPFLFALPDVKTEELALCPADVLLRSAGPSQATRLRRRRRGRNAGGALRVCLHGRLRNRRADEAQDISASAGRELGARAARGVDRHQRHRIRLVLVLNEPGSREEEWNEQYSGRLDEPNATPEDRANGVHP